MCVQLEHGWANVLRTGYDNENGEPPPMQRLFPTSEFCSIQHWVSKLPCGQVITASPTVRVLSFFRCRLNAQTREKQPDSRKPRAEKGSGKASELMLTWEVLHNIYPTHTYHMEDNASYRDIIVTRNVIAKVTSLHDGTYCCYC